MIEFLLMIALLWIILKIMTSIIVLPFRMLHFVLNTPASLIFWVLLTLLIFMALRQSDGTRSGGAYRMRDLYRSTTDRMIFGVCGGIGEYFHVNTTIIRGIFIVLAVFSGSIAFWAYLIAALIIPSDRF